MASIQSININIFLKNQTDLLTKIKQDKQIGLERKALIPLLQNETTQV